MKEFQFQSYLDICSTLRNNAQVTGALKMQVGGFFWGPISSKAESFIGGGIMVDRKSLSEPVFVT